MIDAKLETRLRELLDKQEIHEVLLRYCRGVDRCDIFGGTNGRARLSPFSHAIMTSHE